MKKIIIPRRDHEVYFIPVPEALKPKLIRSFAAAQMEKLHPGFSGETALDIKRLVFNKAQWVMATVMEAETLAEYRILYKGVALFTNTSIAVHKKDFTSGGVQTIGDERIGFDSEKDSPVSIPLESNGSENPQGAGKTFPAGCVVFAGRMPVWRVTAMIACAALAMLVALFFFPAAKAANETVIVPLAVTAAEPAPELLFPPSAIEILSDFSADFVLTGGKIKRWRYNEAQYAEDKSPLMAIETRGIDVISLRKIFAQYDYVVLDDVSDVRYIDGEPSLTIFLSAVREGYLAPLTGTFFSQSFSLPIFSDLTNELKRNGISVVSETLPSAENNNALYTVTYTAKDRALVRSMEAITAIYDKYPVRVKAMDVSIGGDNNIFTVVCSLVQSDAPRYTAMGDEQRIPWDSIPAAFGYKEAAPPPPPPKAIAAPVQTPQVSQPQMPPEQEIKPELSVVGTIRDARGQVLFYRDKEDNKIKTMESFVKP
ncbi:MAG: hypothetical protein LBQ94_12400 [Treponema sp.]|jgi:hypothetical protein|nr:hypothetical protein [Treponema sp.]